MHPNKSTVTAFVVAALALAVAPLLGTPALAVDREVTLEEEAWLAEVQAEVDANGYSWTAGPTSVSHLSQDERAQLLGGYLTEEEVTYFMELPQEPGVENMRFRTSFDWRDYNGVTPADDQGGCGSCWAFGACGATEAHILINEGVTLDLSEQQSIDCNFQGSDCDGGQASHAFQLHQDPGGVLEECYPYLAVNGTSCRQLTCDRVAIIDGQSTISYNVASLKYACETYGPLSVGMCVYDDFYGYTSGCYEHAGTDAVNHVVLLCGWDDSMCGGEGAWLVKNSWGQDFGDNGFFWIKYGSCWIGLGARRPVNAHTRRTRLVPDEYSTIQNAIDNAERGDVIKVAGGTYSGSVALTDYLSVYGGYDPTFTTRDPEAYPTIIDAGGSGHGISCEGRDHMVVEGFQVRNSGASSYGIYIKNSNIAVRDCEVYDNYRGIGIVYGTGGADETALIEYCDVHDNAAAGIFLNDVDNPLVQVNYTAVYDNGAEGIHSNISPVEIRNCTLAGNADGIGLNGGSAVIKNNIIASNVVYGVSCSGVTPVMDYNDVWGNGTGGYDGCSAGANDISVDPIFCGVGSGDVSVHASSPTLGAGEYGVNMGALGIGCPEGPQNLALVQSGAALDLSWDLPPEARVEVDYYVVYRDTAQVPLSSIATIEAGTTTFRDITVPPCEAHNYWVSAVDTSGLEGAPSNRVIGELCYGGPTGLAVAFNEGANELSWTAGDGPIGYYVIERGNELAEPDSVDWVDSGATDYVDINTGDCPRDNYSYRIQPVYDTGWRGVPSFGASIDPAPSPPSGIAAEWIGSDIQLTWDDNCESDFRRYWVYRDTMPISPPIDGDLLVEFTAETSFLDEGLNTDWTYFYRLVATDAASQQSEYSETVIMGTGDVLSVPSPFGTIQAAIDAASAIDTVLVSPGSYSENITLKNGVIVMSSGGSATTSITASSGAVVTAVGVGDLTVLDGFTVDGQGTAQNGLDSWTSYLQVKNCSFVSCNSGANLRYGDMSTLSGNVFSSNSNGVAVSDSSRPFFAGNTIELNTFAGIYNTAEPGPEVGRTLADANDIMDNAFFQVFNLSSGTVDADYNYWGTDCVGDSLFYGLVDYIPWTDASHTGTYTECGNGVEGAAVRPWLSPNFPNPFNPTTAIQFRVPAPGGQVTLSVYDLSGRLVQTLVDAEKPGGEYVAVWHGMDDRGRKVGSGVYFYRLEVGDTRLERKMVMLK
jgi:parallel beta-helix repeat protein